MKLVPNQNKIPWVHRLDYPILPLERALGSLMDRLVPFQLKEGEAAPNCLFIYPFDFKSILRFIEQFPGTRLLSASKRMPRLGALEQKRQDEINAKVAHFRLIDQSAQLRHHLVALLERDFAWDQWQRTRQEIQAGKQGVTLPNLNLQNGRRELVIEALTREQGCITLAAHWLGVSHQAVSAYMLRTNLVAHLKQIGRMEAIPPAQK